MRGMLKNITLAGLLTAAATTAVVGTSTAALADAYCGSSYNVIASDAVQTSSGATWGRVYLTYSSSTGKNCVYTVKSSYVGTATWTTAVLEVQNGSSYTPYVQGDYFKYYAGPVSASAAGKCVRYRGVIGNNTGAPTGSTVLAKGGRDTWGNCG